MGARNCTLAASSPKNLVSVSDTFDNLVINNNVQLLIVSYDYCFSTLKQHIAIKENKSDKYVLEPVNTILDGDLGTITCKKHDIVKAINDYVDDYDISYHFYLVLNNSREFLINMPFTSDQLHDFCNMKY